MLLHRFSNLGLGVWLLVTACGTDIAQTALQMPPGPLDCSSEGALALPSDKLFGDGSNPPSSWVDEGYSAEQGPGLFVAARDAFRVYLNGDLVVESTAPRVGVFVALTLLPGDNALSVVVNAKSGTPAALVQLDELDQSYPSDSSWKVSAAPGPGFAKADYDDSAWSDATDLGVLGSLPGCDPSNFPKTSDAHWIGPAPGAGATVVLRTGIHITPLGYGAATTGGYGATPKIVDNWKDFQALASDPDAPAVLVLPEGVYDFRSAPRDQTACPAACANDASKTQYSVLVSGTCPAALVTRTRTEQRLLLGSNKTIVGLGRGAQVRGVSFEFGTAHNVILRNLAVYDVNRDLIEAGDAFGLTTPSNVWIDHATTKWISDGFDDVRTGAQGITLSWLHYDGVAPDECRGQHARTADVTGATVTFHHCFFDHVESNSPTVRDATARVHLFANVLSDNPSIALDSLCGAEVLLEGNTFQRVSTPTERATCADDTAPGKINAPLGSNYYGPDVGAHR
ncbi:MAG: hypothetical protein ABW061_16780, partial [Polyangiaceae bacterium]